MGCQKKRALKKKDRAGHLKRAEELPMAKVGTTQAGK